VPILIPSQRTSRALYIARRRRGRQPTNGAVTIASRLGLVLVLFVAVLAVATLVSGVTAAGAAYAYFAKDLPDPNTLVERSSTFKTTKIYDRTGQHVLYEIFDPLGGKRTRVALSEIPLDLRNATIAFEDQNFYTNPGFDYRGLLRVAWYAIRGDRIMGASTITQQLIKAVLLSPEQTIDRKIKEIILSVEVSRRFSKDQILEMYLNENNYGNLSYGVEAAAENYFGKTAKELKLAESALLAGLPQAPALHTASVEAMKAQRARVLDSMLREGYITVEQAVAAKAEPIVLNQKRYSIEAPHFVMYVRDLLERRYGTQALYTGGLSVYTTLDLDMQHLAEQRVTAQVDKLRTQFNAHNAALVAIRPDTGEILTMVGSVDYFDNSIDGQVNIATSDRQPGSSFKPFAYVTAFGAGDLRDANGNPKPPLTPATMVMDVRTSFNDYPNPPYIPENVDGKWRGPLRLRQALAMSENIPAIKVTDYAGIKSIISTAHKMGITGLTREGYYGLSITLGGGEVKLLDMAFAYSVFANNGVMAGAPVPPADRKVGLADIAPAAILRVTDSDGKVLEEFREPTRKEVIKPQAAFMLTDIMSDNAARAPFFGWDNPLYLGTRPNAAKTGTTTDWKDNWTMGYTPELVTGVWVGNTNGEQMKNSFGSTAAAPLWHDFMADVYKTIAPFKDTPPSTFKAPAGLERVEVCAVSGLKATKNCPNKTMELFMKGQTPTKECDVHQVFRIDKANGKLATPQTPPEDVEEKVFEIFPPEAADWVREEKIPQPPKEYSDRGTGLGGDVAILTPKPYSYVRGIVPVVGNAKTGDFRLYKVEFGEGLAPSGWIQIGPDHNNTVDNNVLENWDTLGLKGGVYLLQLSVVQNNNNYSQVAIPVTVDNVSPTVKVSYPYTKEVFLFKVNNPEKLRIQAEAKDESAMERVEFFMDDQPIGISTIAPYNVLWPIVLTKTVAGKLVTDTHSIYSIAFDAAGNQQKSDPVTIQIAPEPPKPTSFLSPGIWPDVWRDDPPAVGATG
jgi:penicillin-binding protein 1C